MTTLQAVCGEEGGPMAWTNFYSPKELRNSIVHFIIVNNVPENCLGNNPDFTFDTIKPKLTRKNNWVLSDTIIIVYTKCNCEK
jgi:hypothetical protein